jgi:hypothetical protein
MIQPPNNNRNGAKDLSCSESISMISCHVRREQGEGESESRGGGIRETGAPPTE